MLGVGENLKGPSEVHEVKLGDGVQRGHQWAPSGAAGFLVAILSVIGNGNDDEGSRGRFKLQRIGDAKQVRDAGS